jgi:hypothetical protein
LAVRIQSASHVRQGLFVRIRANQTTYMYLHHLEMLGMLVEFIDKNKRPRPRARVMLFFVPTRVFAIRE